MFLNLVLVCISVFLPFPRFVLDIYKSEERPEDKKLIYKIPLLILKVLQQRNGEECRNYAIYYMNLFRFVNF